MEAGDVNTTLSFKASKKNFPHPDIGKNINDVASVAYDMGQRIFVNESDKEFDLSSNLATLVDSSHCRYARTLAGLRIAAHYLPGFARQKIKMSLDYTSENLPFDTEKYHFSGYLTEGWINKIFLLESLTDKSPSYVMKVNKFSIGIKTLNNKQIFDEAQKQKNEYEEINKAYKDIPDLIPQELYIVANSPHRGMPASIMLQPFIGDKLRDIFDDIEKEELQYLLQSNTEFRNQLTNFLKITKENPKLLSKNIDILGAKNLSVIGEKGKERLIFLDPHYAHTDDQNKYNDRHHQIAARLQYLSGLLESK